MKLHRKNQGEAVRSGFKDVHWAILAAIGTGIATPAGAAQSGQTAEGAQKFLATMAKKVLTQVWFVDAAGRMNYVTGKYSGDVTTMKGGAIGKTKENKEVLPEQFVDKQLPDVRAVTLDAVDVEGRPNACATRITEVTAPNYDDFKSDAGNDTRTFTFTLTYKNEYWKYEPVTKFTSPAQVIDWNDAKVSRGTDGSITVTSKGQTFPTIHLRYAPGDADLADRIEYAMKFLTMSCDESAGTGF